VSKAWVDLSKSKTGNEIKFNRYFYKYTRLDLWRI